MRRKYKETLNRLGVLVAGDDTGCGCHFNGAGIEPRTLCAGLALTWLPLSYTPALNECSIRGEEWGWGTPMSLGQSPYLFCTFVSPVWEPWALGEVSPSFPSPVALVFESFFFFFFIILGLELRASHMAGKCTITEPFVTTPFLKS